MPFTPIYIDPSVASEGFSQNVHLPEGYYLLSIKAIRPSGQDANKTTLMIDCVINEGPPGAPKGAGHTHFGYFAEPGSEKSVSWTWGRPLKAAGLDVSKLEKITFDTYQKFKSFANQLSGRLGGKAKFVALIGDDQYDGKVTSKILECYPASQWSDFQGAAVSTQGSGTATAPGPEVSDEAVSAALDGLLGNIGAAL